MLESAKQKHPPQQAEEVGAKMLVLGYLEKGGDRGVWTRSPGFGGAGGSGAAGPPDSLNLIEATLAPSTSPETYCDLTWGSQPLALLPNN